jgi:hypothetical protein
MNAASRFLLSVVIVAALFMLFTHGDRALHAAVPKDMPANAQFLPSGFDIANDEQQGNWVACRMDDAQNTNWCRVTDTHGKVVFEGDYLPLAKSEPVDLSDLKIAKVNPGKMWVEGPAEEQPVPVIALEDGNLLVPASDRDALAQRWTNEPEELARVSALAAH